ncbi:hypothetical protein PQR53_09445 [Paraburkholderia fungorum]|uniref:hypothetical protein n=1 Tax=Paraburkholderia fungorum TaxID=134537 RepID=UPI0038BAB766
MNKEAVPGMPGTASFFGSMPMQDSVVGSLAHFVRGAITDPNDPDRDVVGVTILGARTQAWGRAAA